MKLQLLSENLQKKIGIINRGVSSRSQLPILLNILLSARDGKLQLVSTDLEIGIQIEIPANVEEEGETTVPAKTFSDLINTLNEGKITLETRKESLEIKTTKTKNTLQTISSEEFPKLYEEKGKKIMVLNQETLQKELPKIIFAASTDEGRPALSGILIKEDESKKGFVFVATDGYRLSLIRHLIKTQKEINNEIEKNKIIPSRVFKEVIGLKEQQKEVSVYVSEEKNQVLFEQDGVIVVGRIIDAEFPDYQSIIPSGFSTKSFFNREEMQKAVKICAIFARESANIVKLNIKEDKIIVSANTPNIGENIVELEAKTEGEENEIAFNSRYLLEFLGNIAEEEMVFEMTGPLNPGVFKVKENSSFLHLIMPIRVQG